MPGKTALQQQGSPHQPDHIKPSPVTHLHLKSQENQWKPNGEQAVSRSPCFLLILEMAVSKNRDKNPKRRGTGNRCYVPACEQDPQAKRTIGGNSFPCNPHLKPCLTRRINSIQATTPSASSLLKPHHLGGFIFCSHLHLAYSPPHQPLSAAAIRRGLVFSLRNCGRATTITLHHPLLLLQGMLQGRSEVGHMSAGLPPPCPACSAEEGAVSPVW